MAAYRAEPSVAPDSTTETFAGLKLRIDNWRWADVPFYLRTGKRLASRATEIAIQFKRAPFQLFRDTPVENLETNRLVLYIQPEEGLSLRFGAKIPGPIMHMGAVEMKFNYVDYFGRTPSTGYERLIYDCMMGDATLFQRADMVEAGWSVITPILDVWKALPPRSFPNYTSGSLGAEGSGRFAGARRPLLEKDPMKHPPAAKEAPRVVFLFDVDNTLLEQRPGDAGFAAASGKGGRTRRRQALLVDL